jgi:hypothetical protein
VCGAYFTAAIFVSGGDAAGAAEDCADGEMI